MSTIFKINEGNVGIEHNGSPFGSFPASSIAMHKSIGKPGHVSVKHFNELLLEKPIVDVEVNGEQLTEDNLCELTTELASGGRGGGGSGGEIVDNTVKFVMFARTTNIFAYSTDGIHWTEGQLPLLGYWTKVAYGNGMFIASTESNFYLWSTDGINWTMAILPSSGFWVANFFLGKFILTKRNSNVFLYGTDGINWTQGTMPASDKACSPIVHGYGRLVSAIGDSNFYVWSTDGINWNANTLGESGGWSKVAYNNGVFIVQQHFSNIYRRTNTITNNSAWQPGTMPGNYQWSVIIAGNGLFVAAVYQSSYFAYSSDGVNWTEGQLPHGGFWWELVYGNGMFMAGCSGGTNAYVYSYDGINWTQGTMPAGTDWGPIGIKTS